VNTRAKLSKAQSDLTAMVFKLEAGEIKARAEKDAAVNVANADAIKGEEILLDSIIDALGLRDSYTNTTKQETVMHYITDYGFNGGYVYNAIPRPVVITKDITNYGRDQFKLDVLAVAKESNTKDARKRLGIK